VEILIRARAPLRISFAGGGTDISPYFNDNGGVVLNATINKFSYVNILPQESQFSIHSIDYNTSTFCACNKAFRLDGKLDLLIHTLDYFRDCFGMHNGLFLTTINDAPPGSGIGSSSALVVATIKGLLHYINEDFKLTTKMAFRYKIAEIAYEIERNICGIKGGMQDQYSASFGGFNLIEFQHDRVLVTRVAPSAKTIDDLRRRLILYYIGAPRMNDVIEKRIEGYKNKDTNAKKNLDALKQLTYKMCKAVREDNLNAFASLLDESWELKKAQSLEVTNDTVDEIYIEAKKAGATAGKLVGAGGGGFMLFYVPDKRIDSVKNRLPKMGGRIINFDFVNDGADSWEV
jgi:D-glycero-alpha-D-manno-heptose-7-phosphate kinase